MVRIRVVKASQVYPSLILFFKKREVAWQGYSGHQTILGISLMSVCPYDLYIGNCLIISKLNLMIPDRDQYYIKGVVTQ